jgi:hypothetical protein
MHHAFSRRFNRRMKTLLKYERRSPRTRVFYRHLKTAAAMLLVVLTLSFGTVMSVEAYRVRFFNIVTEVWEELTSIVVSSDENADLDKLIPISPTYIPDGYKVAESNSNQYENTVIYTDDAGNEIYYAQNLLTQGEEIRDTENAEISTVTLDGQKVMVVKNKGVTQIYWNDRACAFSLISNIGEEELLHMAKAVINQGK